MWFFLHKIVFVCFYSRQLLENTMQGHKNAKEAKRKLQEYKQKIGDYTIYLSK